MAALSLTYNITTNGFELILPISGGTVVSVNWGDTTINTSLSHTYTNSGTYTVTISGTGITTFNYSSGTGQASLTACNSFGEIGLTNLSGMFYNCANLTAVPSTLPTTSIVTNMYQMFRNASFFNQNIGGWTTSSVTSMNYMFYDATNFNGDISGWLTTNVTDMSYMFYNATAFNQNIGGWTTSNVTDMSYMFYNATAFNQNIGSWTTSSVTDMSNMFQNATSFNKDISGWTISNVTGMIAMLNGTALSTTNYDALLNGWAAQTVQPNVPLGAQGLIYTSIGEVGRNILTDSPNNWIITGDTYLPPPPLICFKEGSKILTDTGYKPIETLRKGDLVKTLKHGYKPINMIAKKDIYNPAQKERIKDQLYKCSKEKYPEIFEPLIITGCHSILVENRVTHRQVEQIKKVNGDTYFTDDKLRMPACVDERASVYEKKGNFTIYHIALENDDYYMNYGVYANGLLVETCSKRYLKELSNMTHF